MSNSSNIIIKGLSKEYSVVRDGRKQKFSALKNIDYAFEGGKITGIIGTNGSGKSTLLKILSRITYPSSGTVEIKGTLASLLEVGTGFHPELSGRQNIFLNGSILGMSRSEIKSKFNEIVEFSGVGDFIDTPVKHYSSGMYVRLAFSVAANLTPDILLVDEVLAVGDASFQQKCLAKMNDASIKEKRTVVFVSHNMNAVRQLCDSVIWMKDGQIHMSGPTDLVSSAYLESLDQQSENVGLEHRTDRRGTGEAIITDLQWQSDSNLLVSGTDCKLMVKYSVKDIASVKTVNFRLNIFNDNGDFLTSLSNEMSNFPFEDMPREAQCECLIPNLPLAAGNYYIAANLFINGIKCDRVDRALKFAVAPGDYYKSGKSNEKDSPGVYISQKWSRI